MIRSTYSKRLATLAVVAGAVTVFAPVAQAGYGPHRVADSVETARLAQQRPTSPYGLFRSIESRVADSVDTARAAQQRARAELPSQPGYDAHRVADSVETARLAQQRPTSSYGLFRWLESQAAPLESRLERPQPAVESRGFDWRELSVGAGIAVGLLLVLGGLAVGVVRRARGQVRTA